MTERPILFSAPMVRAILDGRKSMTRRVMVPQLEPDEWFEGPGLYAPAKVDRHGEEYPGDEVFGIWAEDGEWGLRCPFGQPGDRLWCRESWRTERDADDPLSPTALPTDTRILYDADADWSANHTVGRRRSPLHMPRWGSRLTLEICDIRVHRVQEISAEDARAEGVVDGGCLHCGESEPCGCGSPAPSPRDTFASLWDSINAKRGHSWQANPWVWSLSFRRVE